jgi:hypothetical protein
VNMSTMIGRILSVFCCVILDIMQYSVAIIQRSIISVVQIVMLGIIVSVIECGGWASDMRGVVDQSGFRCRLHPSIDSHSIVRHRNGGEYG